MKIVVTTETETYSLEVSEDLELENFKVLCEAESGISSTDIVVAHNGRRLTDDKKSLKDYGIKDGDLIMAMSSSSVFQREAERIQQLQRNPSSSIGINQIDFGSIQIPGLPSRSSQQPSHIGQPAAVSPSNAVAASANSQGQEYSNKQEGGNRVVEQDDLGLGESAGSQDDPAVIRDMLLANPEQLALLKHNNPKLADALTSGDLERFATVLREQQEAKRDRERQRIRLISADPFDMEAQKLIAEEIQQENINANMEAAMEFNPESFGTVHMLYINCLVNGHPVKAFIDSGAQTTIMSQACAERCNIMRLVDTRWAGIAKGVGTQRIIGRVHMGQIQIEGDFLASSFSILEEQPMDMLLGLDMLKRHQMCIDLKENKLIIGTTNSRTNFLHESELPDCARLTAVSEEEDVMKQSERSAKHSEDQALAEALAQSAKESSEEGRRANAASLNTSGSREGRSSSSNTSTSSPMDVGRGPQQQLSSPSFPPESDVKELMLIGFSRDAVVTELRKQNGNKTQAIAALFAKSFKMDH